MTQDKNDKGPAMVLEVIQCDQCGYSGAYESERRAERDGWTFTERGTVCPWCCDCDICQEETR